MGQPYPGAWRLKADSLWACAALGLFVAQQLAVATLADEGLSGIARRAAVIVGSASLLLVALHFRRFLASWLIALGIAMNLAPIVAHGGVMPVSYELVAATGAFPEVTADDIGGTYGRSKDVILRQDDIRLAPLTDRFFVSVAGYKPNIYSAGDFVLFAGVLAAAFECFAFALRPSWRFERLLVSLGGLRSRRDSDAHPG